MATVKIENRRKTRVSDQLLWWGNFIAGWLAGVPLILEPLRGTLPPEYYGWLAFGVAMSNWSIAYWQRYTTANPRVPDDGSSEAGA